MAYENDILTRNDDDELSVRVVQSTGDNPAVAYDDVYTRDDNGKLAVRVVGAGGGDTHNKGYFATPEALRTAYPTAQPGDFAIVESTDTVWVWDSDTSNWKDSDTKGQVTSVNNQTGAVTLGINDVAPTQTGKSGYVLGTDGFVAGWVKPEIVQVSALPAASEDEVDNIYQYVGTTDANYTNGYFYKCVSDGQNPATYSWERVDVQPSATKHKYTVTLEMIQGETMTTAFYMRGAEGKTTNLNITQFMSYEEGGVWGDPYFDGQYIGFLKSGADGISASKIVALNTETNNLGFDVYATDDNDEPIIEFVADYAPSYVTEDSVKVIFEIESDEPLVEVETSEAGVYLGEICITQAVPYLSLTAPSGSDQNYVLQNRNGEQLSWVAAPSGLPSQTGQSGKFLTTDGTDASWAAVDAIQVSAMPVAAVGELDKIYQFIGTTDANYTNGYFYKCVSDGGNPATYSWENIAVQPSSGGQTIQYNTMPTAGADTLDKIVQYVGVTDSNYTNGCFYKGVYYSGSGTYAWAIVYPVDLLQHYGDSTKSLALGEGANIKKGAYVQAYCLAIGDGASASNNYTVAVGAYATASGDNGIAVGEGARTSGSGSIQIGYTSSTNTGASSIAIGSYTFTNSSSSVVVGNLAAASNATSGVAVGANARVQARNAIQLGTGTNSEAGTLYIGSYYNNAAVNYKLLDADGTIPADRLPNAINKYSTMPTAASTNEGWIVQYTGATDATYTHGYIYECVSDGGNPATYSWTAVQVQAGGGGSLPSQTGNSGKFLTTDGTDASWATINALQNGTSVSGALSILGSTSVGQNSISIGSGASAWTGGVCVGRSSRTEGSGVSIGNEAISSNPGTICVGFQAKTTADYAIQIGTGTNSVAKTLQIGLGWNSGTSAYDNYILLSADGTIPTDRFTTTPVADGTYVPTLTISSGTATRTWAAPSGGGVTATTVTLALNDWSSNTQTVNVTGVTSSSVIILQAAPASQADYTRNNVYCSAQGNGTLTFTCVTTPLNAITVNVIIM